MYHLYYALRSPCRFIWYHSYGNSEVSGSAEESAIGSQSSFTESPGNELSRSGSIDDSGCSDTSPSNSKSNSNYKKQLFEVSHSNKKNAIYMHPCHTSERCQLFYLILLRLAIPMKVKNHICDVIPCICKASCLLYTSPSPRD